MTIDVPPSAVAKFVVLCQEIERAGSAAQAELRSRGLRTAPADQAIAQARLRREMAEGGRLASRRGTPLGMSRAFSDSAPPGGLAGLGSAISEAERYWDDELNAGDFEVRDA